MSDYQFDHHKKFVQKLTQVSKTPSSLNLESWSEFNINVSASDNYDRGYNAALAQVAIEARKLLFKTREMSEFPFVRRSKIEEAATLDRAQYEVREADLPIVPDVVDDPRMPLKEIEKAHIIRVLNLKGFNKTQAAQSLGITVKTLYNKLKEHDIENKPTILKLRSGRK
jgi:DNA-binding NtrC family response regulator